MSWSEKYKKSIDCSSPKGFSQKAHCQGRKKRNENNMKLSELKEVVRQMVKEAGPSRGFNKLASIYQKEALKHQDMVQNQKKLAASFVAEKDPKKKEKAKKEIINHHQKVKAQEKKMKDAEYDMMNALNKEKIELDESVNEAMKPSQVRSAISKVKKQLMRKWKQKGGYENFGQKELSQMKDKFDYNPYGSPDERQISKMLDGFDDWAMNYDGNMREARRSVVHKAAKKGSFPVSLVVVKNGKVIDQELVNTPMEVPAAFNVIQSKHKGATIHIEDKTGKKLFSESLEEMDINDPILVKLREAQMRKNKQAAKKIDNDIIKLGGNPMSESVVTEAKDMKFTDYLEILDKKFLDAMKAVRGDNGSDAAITPTRGDILQNFTLFRNYISALTKKYKGDKTKLRFLTEKVREYESVNEGKEPEIITQLRDVMKSGYKTLKDPKSGKRMKVDSYSASAIVGVYDKLKPSTQEKFVNQGLMGMQSFAFKVLR